MSGFTVVRLLDARLTDVFPLSYYAVETLDPMFANLGFLMYVNFLGLVLQVRREERFHWRCRRFLQFSIGILVPVPSSKMPCWKARGRRPRPFSPGRSVR